MSNEIITSTPVYVSDADTCGNPYRLTPYVNEDGEIWLRAEGNGAADDVMVEDIVGWTREELESKIGLEFNTMNMRHDADEIEAAGDKANADWLRDWCDTYDRIRGGNNTFTVMLVDNGTYMQWVRDGRTYAPTAKRTLAEAFASEAEAEHAAGEAFADCDELDHIVVCEYDENFDYVAGF